MSDVQQTRGAQCEQVHRVLEATVQAVRRYLPKCMGISCQSVGLPGGITAIGQRICAKFGAAAAAKDQAMPVDGNEEEDANVKEENK
jgi:hypothetical protein